MDDLHQYRPPIYMGYLPRMPFTLASGFTNIQLSYYSVPLCLCGYYPPNTMHPYALCVYYVSVRMRGIWHVQQAVTGMSLKDDIYRCELLAGAALVHRADPSEPCRVGMMSCIMTTKVMMH